MTGNEVGTPRRRKEDARLITGQTRWTDNIQPPGMLHVAFLRSPMAHARIIRINPEEARQQPGVVAVYTGKDLEAEQGLLPLAWPVTEDIQAPQMPPMAIDEVRFSGEAVACVVATDRYKAADALEAIDVDYEPLPAIMDMEQALADDSPKLHEAGNQSYTWTYSNGDIEAAFENAAIRLDRTYVQQRMSPAAMEPRSVVVEPFGDQVTVYSATQIPHILKTLLTLVTGAEEHKTRVIAPDVGGGFGGKLSCYGEEVICFVLARKLGKPVKWTQTRTEDMQGTHHARDQIQRISVAANEDGRIRGLQVELLADMGAYTMLLTPSIPILGAYMYNAIYKMDAYDFRCTGVFTTKMPTGAYRGAGRPEATYAIERIMDELAHELHLDPIELRRRNWIGHDEFPYTTIAGLTYDSGNYEAATDRALQLLGYDKLRAEQRDRRDRGETVQLGIGVSTYTEMCGLAPSRWLGEMRYAAGGWEHATIRVLPTGKVEVATGTSPHGQGHVTAWSQVVADALGVSFDDVTVLHGDTASSRGMDTYGSRSLTVGGLAVQRACDKVIEKARRVAAYALEADAADVDFAEGRFGVRGTPDGGKTLVELALFTWAAHDLPADIEPSLDAEVTVDPDDFSFPHGTHLCAVEVDTETGGTKIRSYVAVDDIGRAVNPLIVDGQVHGGVVQGIGQALFEEAVYDADGNLLTSTLADYLLPSAADLPTILTDRTETPSTSNALGVKGVGEAGTIAATPAVVNAVVDALRPYGVRDVQMPCTPERIWRRINDSRTV